MYNLNTYFLVASLRRCGSSYLSLELDSYENVFCQFEHIYRESKFKQPAHILIDNSNFSFVNSIDRIANKQQFRGTKLPLPEYQTDDIKLIISSLVEEPIRIVHIIRDFHESMVSILRAQKSGVWLVHDEKKSNVPKWMKGDKRHVSSHNSKNDTEQGLLKLTPEMINKYCKNALYIDKNISSLKGSNPYISVRYRNIRKSIPKILEFIGACDGHGNIPTKTKIQTSEKIINKPSSELIANWDQVSDIFHDWESKRDYIN
jgi:hypothetical protein